MFSNTSNNDISINTIYDNLNRYIQETYKNNKIFVKTDKSLDDTEITENIHTINRKTADIIYIHLYIEVLKNDNKLMEYVYMIYQYAFNNNMPRIRKIHNKLLNMKKRRWRDEKSEYISLDKYIEKYNTFIMDLCNISIKYFQNIIPLTENIDKTWSSFNIMWNKTLFNENPLQFMKKVNEIIEYNPSIYTTLCNIYVEKYKRHTYTISQYIINNKDIVKKETVINDIYKILGEYENLISKNALDNRISQYFNPYEDDTDIDEYYDYYDDSKKIINVEQEMRDNKYKTLIRIIMKHDRGVIIDITTSETIIPTVLAYEENKAYALAGIIINKDIRGDVLLKVVKRRMYGEISFYNNDICISKLSLYKSKYIDIEQQLSSDIHVRIST